MKIIKRGTIPEDRTHRATCSNCATVFEFTQSEVTQVQGRSERDAGLLGIGCPVCHRQCTVAA